jgi:hypothetical protein
MPEEKQKTFPKGKGVDIGEVNSLGLYQNPPSRRKAKEEKVNIKPGPPHEGMD